MMDKTDQDMEEFVEQHDKWFLTRMWICATLSGLPRNIVLSKMIQKWVNMTQD